MLTTTVRVPALSPQCGPASARAGELYSFSVLDERPIGIGLRSNCYPCPARVGLRSAKVWQQRWHNAVKFYTSTGICTRPGAQLSTRRCEEGGHTMFRRLFYPLVLTVYLVSTVVTGCAPVTVQQTTLKNAYTDVRADVLSTGELSQMTQQTLRMQGVKVAAQEPLRMFQDLDTRSAPEPDDDQQVALAEIALLNAMRNDSVNPTTAADWYLLAAARSYDFIFAKAPGSPLFDLRYERMRFFYLRAVAGFLQQIRSASGSFAAQQRTIAGQPYVVDMASGPGLLDPNTFDE